MKFIFKMLALLFGYFGFGFVVSKIEKKNYWVKNHIPHGIYEKHLKRPLDFSLAMFILILLSPFLLIIAIAVRINMGSPIMFTQDRPGLGGEIFKIMKFRTMTDARDEEGNLLPDDERLTKFGRWLRSTSCDELPELISIIRGDMSLIGPRPLLVEYLPYYTKEEKHRHDVLPGLTGMAQVHGRNTISWEEKFSWDLKYVNDITCVGDFRIILETIAKVFKRADIRVGKEHAAGRLDVTRRSKTNEGTV